MERKGQGSLRAGQDWALLLIGRGGGFLQAKRGEARETGLGWAGLDWINLARERSGENRPPLPWTEPQPLPFAFVVWHIFYYFYFALRLAFFFPSHLLTSALPFSESESLFYSGDLVKTMRWLFSVWFYRSHPSFAVAGGQLHSHPSRHYPTRSSLRMWDIPGT